MTVNIFFYNPKCYYKIMIKIKFYISVIVKNWC